MALVFTIFPAQEIHESAKKSEFSLTFWNVGQGDFITLITPQGCMAFDVGGSLPVSRSFLKFLKENCPRGQIKTYVSHFDKDHIFNHQRLLNALFVSEAFFSHLAPKTKFAKKLLDSLKRRHSNIQEIRQGYQEKMGDFRLKCLWPPRGSFLGKGENDWSLVLLLEGPHIKFLLTGDLPGKLEEKLPNISVDVLKVPHHGGRNSTTTRFLDRIHARTCIVSVGATNHYGHPSLATLERMSQRKCAILRTDKLGNIVFRF